MKRSDIINRWAILPVFVTQLHKTHRECVFWGGIQSLNNGPPAPVSSQVFLNESLLWGMIIMWPNPGFVINGKIEFYGNPPEKGENHFGVRWNLHFYGASIEGEIFPIMCSTLLGDSKVLLIELCWFPLMKFQSKSSFNLVPGRVVLWISVARLAY